ncbi:hypothetical protein S40285_01908 [Stachybotrys chlorohalonatus IBT 40285]|uniref:Uncharacterized protein n=1 Tax=Stachybotrys chlorohalonatus (strain IBT 40285) TaxID=1283841 RepID=A0A084QQM9_STAC4|nr:hypothetical protein S40285_01908 [Stachybotrys chlorohalonata IBT 40285]
MEVPGRNPAMTPHAASVDLTLKELEREVKALEADLAKLQAKQHDAPPHPMAQAELLKAALDEVTDSKPFLPFPGSVLPALLALRRTQETIAQSRAFLASHKADVEQAQRQLESDQSSFRDQRLLAEALETRLQSLREDLNSTAGMQPKDGVRKRKDELRERKRNYDKETVKLLASMNKFIDDSLAAMLAAEVLGGPVVGDAMDLDTDDLAAGFNSQGKLNKPKGVINQDKRQRRIDQIWGAADDQAVDDGQDNEVAAAGNEMKQLTEELLNRLVDASGDGSASYVRLPRESAAARFLVRSKVAQFHPKDATRIRLFDFGRELDE